MITKFKLFEGTDTKEFYYHSVKKNDILKLDNRLKKYKIKHTWFELQDSEDIYSVIAIMTERQKNAFKKGFTNWMKDLNTCVAIISKFEPIHDIEMYLQLKKYNL